MLKNCKHVKLANLYYFNSEVSKKKVYNLRKPNVKYQLVYKCFYSGYSRGIKYGFSRMTTTIQSFKGNLNDIGLAR